MPGSGNDATLALRRLVMLIAPPTLKVVKMKFSVKVSGFSVKVNFFSQCTYFATLDSIMTLPTAYLEPVDLRLEVGQEGVRAGGGREGENDRIHRFRVALQLHVSPRRRVQRGVHVRH